MNSNLHFYRNLKLNLYDERLPVTLKEMENFFNPANDWQWNIYDLIPDMYQHLKLFAFFSRGE